MGAGEMEFRNPRMKPLTVPEQPASAVLPRGLLDKEIH